MKKKGILILAVLLCLSTLAGCDPVLPSKNIEATCTPNPLIQGASANIEIIYPDTEGTAIVKWTDQKVIIINGDDVVEVSGLTIAGLKPGTALFEVTAKANCSFMGFIVDKPIFSTEIEVAVKAEY